MKGTPVVVLNMHYSGLGIARSLAPLGVPVFGLSAHAEFPGSATRYCRFRNAPDSLLDPDGLEAFLIQFAGDLGVRPILFPTRDHDVEFLLERRDRLESHYTIPMADRDVIERAMNKDRCFAMASECGIKVPRSHTVRSDADIDDLRRQLSLPVVVKPLYARQWRKPGIWDAVGREKALQFDDWESLERFYRRVSTLDPLVTVQEYVPGPESNLVIYGSYCRPGGQVHAYFTARKLLQVPPLRGTGVVVEGLPLGGIAEPSNRLLGKIGFNGISEIEYKIHAITGVPYLIEVNPRHWDQHHLGTVCGVNLTREWYLDIVGASRSADHAGRQVETPVRWFADQEFALYAASALLKRGRAMRNVRDLLNGKKTFAVLDWHDPKPGLRQAGNVMGILSRAAINRLHKARNRSPQR